MNMNKVEQIKDFIKLNPHIPIGMGIGATFGAFEKEKLPKNSKDADSYFRTKAIIKGAISGGLTSLLFGGMRARVRSGGYNYSYGTKPNTRPFNKNKVGSEFESILKNIKTKAEAKSKYYEYSKRYHPDKNIGDLNATENSKNINSVWEDFKKYEFDKLAFLRNAYIKGFQTIKKRI